jgi:DNA-binding NtrC family response regulator
MTRSILVVDDDRTMVKTLCAVLQRRGWTTTAAYSGEEAVERSAREQFAAVLMDVKMSGMNGVEAFRAIKAVQPRARVILMTAYAAHELLEEAEREGVLKVLSKPVPLDALQTLLDEALRARHGVLIVDDDPEFLKTLSEVVAARGHLVLRAGSLDEALELIAQDEPAVVLLDLRLDTVPPREAVVAIRQANPAAGLILYSGHTQVLDETVVSVPAEWIRASLTKPIPLDQLMALLG